MVLHPYEPVCENQQGSNTLGIQNQEVILSVLLGRTERSLRPSSRSRTRPFRQIEADGRMSLVVSHSTIATREGDAVCGRQGNYRCSHAYIEAIECKALFVRQRLLCNSEIICFTRKDLSLKSQRFAGVLPSETHANLGSP